MPLIDFQNDALLRLEKVLSFCNWAILQGSEGFGKRKITEHMAAKLGLEFVVLSLAGREADIRSILLCQANIDKDQQWRGGLLATDNSCLLLTDIEKAQAGTVELITDLARASVRSGGGRDISASLVVIELKKGLSSQEHHELSTLLRLLPLIKLRDAISPAELVDAIRLIAKECSTESDIDIDNLPFQFIPSDGLHTVKKWIVEAIAEEGKCTVTSIRNTMARSMVYYLDHLIYRGRAVTLEQYKNWVGQFAQESRDIADRIIRAMVDNDYFINLTFFHDAVTNLVHASGIPIGSNGVVFCDWQPFFKSSSYITREIKDGGDWGRYANSIDLKGPPESWALILGQSERWVVIADDIIGTGTSISAIIPKIIELLTMFPKIRLRALFLTGFADGAQQLKSLEKRFGPERYSLSISRLLFNKDTCFHPDSLILDSDKDKVLLDMECNRLKEIGLRLPARGYGDLGALIVFPSSVPNCTLPLIWFDRSDKWKPLFPASHRTSI